MTNKFLMVRVLKECNWKCPYCEYAHNHKVPDEDKAIEIFDKHKDVVTHITGGEPGLLSTRFWDHVFNTRDVGVLTNGLFITKGYYEKYHNKIIHLYVHATPELDIDISPAVLRVLRSGDPIVEASVVIHKRNTHLVNQFIKKYPEIYFNITMSGSQFQPDMGFNITDKYTALEVIDQLKEFPKYSYFVSKLLKAITSNYWNLCFIPKEKVSKCSECPVRCWVDV